MRITWLLEATDEIWGGVKVALEDANWLHDRGHQVTVLSRTGPPAWMELRCPFRRVAAFTAETVPPGDVVIGTFWTTVEAAVRVDRGVPLHFCQGYEGDMPEQAAQRERIEAVYRLPQPRRITIAPHLTRLLRERFGIEAREVPYAIDHDVMRPGPMRDHPRPLRVGLVGPYQIPWKDIATGLKACELASRAGLDLQLVRITNTARAPQERDLPFPVEWHEKVQPQRMGELYRSLDLFVGSSRGSEEGFFLPAVEAMACGVPCVLTDIPCFRGYGSGQYALFVPPQDPAAMAEGIVVAGRMPDVRKDLRRNGLATAARFHRDAHCRELEAALLAFAGVTPQPTPLSTAAPVAPRNATPAAAPAELATAARLTAEAIANLQRAGEVLRRHGEWRRAAAVAEALAALQQDDREALRHLANTRFLADDHPGALAAFDRLLELGADDDVLHLCRAKLLYALERHQDSAQAFRAAIAAGSPGAEVHNDLGVVLYRCGDATGARRSFERALALDPAHADARANLADIGEPAPRRPLAAARP